MRRTRYATLKISTLAAKSTVRDLFATSHR
jgi:hypothetical protein